MPNVEKAETTFNLILIAFIVGIVAYGLYKLTSGWSSFKKSPQNQLNNGQAATGFDALGNLVVPATAFPGGETPNTSETQTGATLEILSHPIDSFKSIFGIGDNGNTGEQSPQLDTSDLSHETSQIQGGNLVAGDGGGE